MFGRHEYVNLAPPPSCLSSALQLVTDWFLVFFNVDALRLSLVVCRLFL